MSRRPATGCAYINSPEPTNVIRFHHQAAFGWLWGSSEDPTLPQIRVVQLYPAPLQPPLACSVLLLQRVSVAHDCRANTRLLEAHVVSDQVPPDPATSRLATSSPRTVRWPRPEAYVMAALGQGLRWQASRPSLDTFRFDLSLAAAEFIAHLLQEHG